METACGETSFDECLKKILIKLNLKLAIHVLLTDIFKNGVLAGQIFATNVGCYTNLFISFLHVPIPVCFPPPSSFGLIMSSTLAPAEPTAAVASVSWGSMV